MPDEGQEASSRDHFGDRHVCTPECPQAPSIARPYPSEGRETTDA